MTSQAHPRPEKQLAGATPDGGEEGHEGLRPGRPLPGPV